VKKLLNFGGLRDAIKYVFVASKGDVLSEAKEDGGETMAELVQPLAVGTGALSDMCACLKRCAKSDTENAYADLGDGHDIAGQPGTKREHLSHREHQVVVPRNSHQSKSFVKTVTATTITGKKHAPLGNHVLEKSSITNGMSLSGEEEIHTIDKVKVASQAISLLNNGWDASDEAIQQQAEKKKLKEQTLQGKEDIEKKTGTNNNSTITANDDVYSSIGNSLRHK